MQGHIGAAVLDCVVEEVEEDIGEVDLIPLHPGIQGVQVELQVSATLLGVEGINLRYGQEQLIDVQGLQREAPRSSVQQRELQYLVDEELHTLRLQPDDIQCTLSSRREVAPLGK